jgi:argininosuccinate synthase
MNVADLRGKTIGFAASGGLDSCTITHWLTGEGVNVVCLTADMAQPDEASFDEIGQRMRACGAVDFVGIDLKKQIAEAGMQVIRAQARYEGRYWNTTGIGRQVIVAGMLPEVKRLGLSVTAHGATGRGNDQVRFQLISNMLAPEISVYAPWRDPAFLARFKGRQEMIRYCEQHGLPIKATRDAPYSTDANLLGLTHEGGRLESLETPAGFVTSEMGSWAKDAPDEAQTVSIRFLGGHVEAIDGQAVDNFSAMDTANRIGGRHGIGIGSHVVENRFVGVKSRGVYEAPGMELIGQAYEFLLQLVLDRRAREMFDQASVTASRQIYQGYWNDVASRMTRRVFDEAANLATGTIEVSLYRGNIGFVSARDVPHSLFTNDGSMEAEGSFDHSDSEGFLRVLAVNARAIARAGQVAQIG